MEIFAGALPEAAVIRVEDLVFVPKLRAECKNCGKPISKVEGFSWNHVETHRYECARYPHAEPKEK